MTTAAAGWPLLVGSDPAAAALATRVTRASARRWVAVARSHGRPRPRHRGRGRRRGCGRGRRRGCGRGRRRGCGRGRRCGCSRGDAQGVGDGGDGRPERLALQVGQGGGELPAAVQPAHARARASQSCCSRVAASPGCSRSMACCTAWRVWARVSRGRYGVTAARIWSVSASGRRRVIAAISATTSVPTWPVATSGASLRPPGHERPGPRDRRRRPVSDLGLGQRGGGRCRQHLGHRRRLHAAGQLGLHHRHRARQHRHISRQLRPSRHPHRQVLIRQPRHRRHHRRHRRTDIHGHPAPATPPTPPPHPAPRVPASAPAPAPARAPDAETQLRLRRRLRPLRMRPRLRLPAPATARRATRTSHPQAATGPTGSTTEGPAGTALPPRRSRRNRGTSTRWGPRTHLLRHWKAGHHHNRTYVRTRSRLDSTGMPRNSTILANVINRTAISVPPWPSAPPPRVQGPTRRAVASGRHGPRRAVGAAGQPAASSVRSRARE